MKIVINTCYGGFGLSEAAYEKLIEYGIPVRAYKHQDPVTRRYLPEPENGGEVIFDSTLDPEGRTNGLGHYWETWLGGNRTHPLLIRVVEELGTAANGDCAKLKVVEVPDGISWTITEYDGLESVAETHRTWS